MTARHLTAALADARRWWPDVSNQFNLMYRNTYRRRYITSVIVDILSMPGDGGANQQAGLARRGEQQLILV